MLKVERAKKNKLGCQSRGQVIHNQLHTDTRIREAFYWLPNDLEARAPDISGPENIGKTFCSPKSSSRIESFAPPMMNYLFWFSNINQSFLAKFGEHKFSNWSSPLSVSPYWVRSHSRSPTIDNYHSYSIFQRWALTHLMERGKRISNLDILFRRCGIEWKCSSRFGEY